MKSWTLGLLAGVVSMSLQAADSLHIKAGQTHTLDAGKTEWVLSELVLEDNATLLIPAGVGQLQLDAAKAVIGKDVRIVATGGDGKPGAAGGSRDGKAANCEDGAAGDHGEHGAAGGDGVVLNLTLRIARLDSLAIDTRGGVGGAGGAGGKGQDAGEFDSCNAPTGGDGGRGGDGGDGGSGGHVRVFYTLLPESGLSGTLGDRIKVAAEGGKAAAGGEGGKGGEGGPGKFVTMKTLSGNKKWVAGGKVGSAGVPGKAGRDGSKGQILIQQDLRSRMDELARQQTAQVEAIGAQMTAKLAEGQAATQASTAQTLQTLDQDVAALKGAVAGLATQAAVQKQGADLEARTAKLEQTLEAVMQRLDQLERKLAQTVGKPAANPATP